MSLALYSWIALPLWTVIFGLYFVLRRNRLHGASLAAKWAGTFLAVGSAGLALYTGGETPWAQLVFWFFLLSSVADVLLELHFLLGMGLFAVAHVCYLVWLWGCASPTWWSLLIWGIAMIGAAFLFRRELPRMGLLAVAACLYVGVLAGSLALALPLPFLGRPDLWPMALGMPLFFVSDMMVAKTEFSGLDDRWQKPVMLLYWGALFLIAAALWR